VGLSGAIVDMTTFGESATAVRWVWLHRRKRRRASKKHFI